MLSCPLQSSYHIYVLYTARNTSRTKLSSSSALCNFERTSLFLSNVLLLLVSKINRPALKKHRKICKGNFHFGAFFFVILSICCPLPPRFRFARHRVSHLSVLCSSLFHYFFCNLFSSRANNQNNAT